MRPNYHPMSRRYHISSVGARCSTPSPTRASAGASSISYGLALLPPLTALQGYTSPELERVFERAISLGEELEDTEEIFPALSCRAAFEIVTGRTDLALVHTEEAIALAKRSLASGADALAGRLLATIKLIRGDPAGACKILQQELSIHERGHHRATALVFRPGSGYRVHVLSLPGNVASRLHREIEGLWATFHRSRPVAQPRQHVGICNQFLRRLFRRPLARLGGAASRRGGTDGSCPDAWPSNVDRYGDCL